jgi:hypothetical protein
MLHTLPPLPPPSLPCEEGPRCSGPSTDPAASSSGHCGRPCTAQPSASGHQRPERPAQTPWASLQRRSAHSPALRPGPSRRPAGLLPPQHRGWQTRPGPTPQLRLPPGLRLVGYSPTLQSSRAQKREFHTGLRHRLGLAVLSPNAPDVQCGCGVTLRRTDADHGMRCSALAAQTTLRHDILKGILRRAVHWAGIASTLEPTLRRLPGLTDGPGMFADGSPSRLGARGDILLPKNVAIVDVSVINPLSINSLSSAAALPGAAAARRDHQKRTAYAGVEPNGYAFVPISVESYGRIGQPAMKLLRQLGDEAAGPGGITRASFVAGTLCDELSVGLCMGTFLMYRVSGGMFAQVSG